MGKLLALDRDRALRPLALQDPAAGPLLGAMDEATRMGSWHFVDDDGRVTSGGRAFGPLLAHLPAGRALARLADRGSKPSPVAARCAGRLIPGAAKQRARDRIAERQR